MTPDVSEDFVSTILLETSIVNNTVFNLNNSLPTVTGTNIFLQTQSATENLIYCQNFNRMKGPAKMKQIYKNLLASSYSVILATETNWNESVRSEEMFGSLFNVYRYDRDLQTSEKESGGGVLIAVSAKFNSEIIPSSTHKGFEHVWVKSQFAGETHVFASVYFPPLSANKDTYDKFFKCAEKIISELSPEVKVHIYGDFNQPKADFIPDSENVNILLPVIGDNITLHSLFDEIAKLGLNQVNHVRNRINRSLDFLLTNVQEDFCVTESLNPLWKNEKSHTAIEYSLFMHSQQRPNDYEYEEVFDYKLANYDNLKNKLNCINWQQILRNVGNVESAVDIFYELLSIIISEEVPLKKKRRYGNTKYPIWFNGQIKHLKNRKQKAHKIYKKHNSSENLASYLEICDQLNSEINSAFEEYNFRTELEIKSCPKNFFSYVKTKLKSDNFPSTMHLDDHVGDNPEKICDLFASFFSRNLHDIF